MKRIPYRLLAAILAAGLVSLPAVAANNFVVKDGNAASLTKCSKDVGSGVQADCNVLTDASGVEKGTASNPLIMGPVAGGVWAASQSGTWNITNISGTISLPTGAATSALQTTANGYLSTIAAAAGDTTTPSPVKTNAGDVLTVGGSVTIAGGSFTRPANTTGYTANSVYANSTTAGSVTPVSAAICRIAQGHGTILRGSISISNPLAYLQSFRLHIFKTSPTTTAGDGGAWLGSVNIVAAIERGTIDITLTDKGSDGAKGWGVATVGSAIAYDCASGSTNMFVMTEILGAYTPLSTETATIALEAVPD